MFAALSILGVLFLFLAPGYLAILVAGGRELTAKRISLVEGTFAAVALSLLLTTALSLGLAAVGLFSPVRLFLAVAAIVSALTLVLARRGIRLVPWKLGWESAAVAGLLASFALLYLPPSEFVFGGHDKGTYLNAAAQVERDGALWFEDELLTSLAGDRSFHSELYLPGFYFADGAQRGPIVSHGFHFYTAYLTALFAVGGLPFALAGPCLLALLSLCAAYVLVSRLAGRPVGFAVAVLLGINPMTVWFSRQTVAEGMCEALILSAAALLFMGWRESTSERRLERWSASTLMLSGALLAALHLTKIEFLLLPTIVLGFVFLAWVRGRSSEARSFALGYGAVLGVAIVFACTTHRVYALAVFEAYGELNQVLTIAGLASLPLAGVALWFGRRWLRDLVHRPDASVVLVVACVLTLLATTALYLMGPTPFPVQTLSESEIPWLLAAQPDWLHADLFWSGRNLQGLSFYLTVPGLFLGVLGLFLLLRRSAAFSLGPILVFALIQTALYIHVTTPSVGHMTSHRRFLAVSLPVLLIAAIVPLFLGDGRGVRAKIKKVFGTLLCAYLGAQFLLASWPHLWNTPWPASRETVRSIARAAPLDVVWVASSRDALALRYLVPLKFLDEQRTFVIDEHAQIGEQMATLHAALVERGLTPVALVGEETPLALWIRSHPELFEPSRTKVISIDEPTLVGRYLRLPDADDFSSWSHELILYEPR